MEKLGHSNLQYMVVAPFLSLPLSHSYSLPLTLAASGGAHHHHSFRFGINLFAGLLNVYRGPVATAVAAEQCVRSKKRVTTVAT